MTSLLIPFENRALQGNWKKSRLMKGCETDISRLQKLSISTNVYLGITAKDLVSEHLKCVIEEALHIPFMNLSLSIQGHIGSLERDLVHSFLNAGIFVAIVDDQQSFTDAADNRDWAFLVESQRIILNVDLNELQDGAIECSFVKVSQSLAISGIFDDEKLKQLMESYSLPSNIYLIGETESLFSSEFVRRSNAKVIFNDHALSESFGFEDLLIKTLHSDREDGLIPTVVTDMCHVALGLVYSSHESVREAIRKERGIYESRRRGLWEKGLTSGAVQILCKIEVDCDSDCLRFVVKQEGHGFCHLNRRSCWSSDSGIGHLFRTLESRKKCPVEKSYTNRLFNDERLLQSKIIEEAYELIDANENNHIIEEVADLFYFVSVLCAREGIRLHDIELKLDQRTLKTRRRPGNSKSFIDQKLLRHQKK